MKSEDTETMDTHSEDVVVDQTNSSKSVCFEFFRPKTESKRDVKVERVVSSFISLSQRVFLLIQLMQFQT